MVVGGNHGDTAFQFGASVSVELADNCIIDFEVSVCKLICRKDTGCLLEQTILPRLTDGLEIIATFELQIFNDDECGMLVAEYRRHAGPIQNATPSHIPTTKVFVMGDLGLSRPWLLEKSPWQGTGACNARPRGSNLVMTASCGRWTSL